MDSGLKPHGVIISVGSLLIYSIIKFMFYRVDCQIVIDGQLKTKHNTVYDYV